MLVREEGFSSFFKSKQVSPKQSNTGSFGEEAKYSNPLQSLLKITQQLLFTEALGSQSTANTINVEYPVSGLNEVEGVCF